MKKPHILTWAILLLILSLSGGQLSTGTAAPITPSESSPKIEIGVWKALAASPTREVTVVVSLVPEGNGGPELAIDAQFRLENALALLREFGTVRAYEAFYGSNVIKVTGRLGLLHLLESWPELESVTLYQPGAPWEVQAEQVLRSGVINGSGLITGTVTTASGTTPLAGITVTAYRQTGTIEWTVAGTTSTDSSGNYAISGLVTGIYRAKFTDLAGNYAEQFYDNQSTFTMATNFDVADGQVTPSINADMALAGRIGGTITKVGGGAAPDVVASAWLNAGGGSKMISNAVSASNGTYTIGGLPPGSYRVRFADVYFPPRYLPEWYDNVLNEQDAEIIIVTAGALISNIDADMGSYGSITGNVKADDGLTNLAGIDVDVYVYQEDPPPADWIVVSSGQTDASGNYEAYDLDSKFYRVKFTDSLGQFAAEFYDDQPNLDLAANVWVDLGHATTNVNAQLSLQAQTVSLDWVSGWNLVSLPVMLSDSSLPTAFDSIAGSYGDVFAYETCGVGVWKIFNPDIPMPPGEDEKSLTAVDVESGYWVNMSTPDTVVLDGVHPLTTTINLCPGWNLIGYPSLAMRPVEEALASISGQYSLVRQYRASDATPWKSYNPNLPPSLNTLVNMEPGYGYWIYMTTAGTLYINGR